jgi:hypothetical protein
MYDRESKHRACHRRNQRQEKTEMGRGSYAKSFPEKPTNAAPAASIPKLSYKALLAAPVELVFPEDDPNPVELEDPAVATGTPPVTAVVPLRSGQVLI